MSEAETLYHQIAEALPDAKAGKLFGAQCLKAPNGKALAFFYKEEMVFKLTGEAEQEALALDGAHYFNPMDDRPMNGWVQVAFHYADRWLEFAEAALGYVRGLR
ncbi:MAG: hypothetical protein ABIP44_01545 [Pseudoxanthomonas sp.]